MAQPTSGLWKNSEKYSTGTGKASQGKTKIAVHFDGKKSGQDFGPSRPSAKAGLRGSAIRVGDNDADDRSSS